MTTPFWFKDPTILFKKGEINKLWPAETMTNQEKLNAISRLVIILTLLGLLITQSVKILITGLVTLGVIAFLDYTQNEKDRKENTKNLVESVKEGFSNANVRELTKEDFTSPTEKNPAMNVLLPEIKDNPNRKPAAPSFNPEVGKKMDDSVKDMVSEKFNDSKIDERLFKDLGDNFNFDQSMRSFHPTANTQIPNDQKAFADFCYGDMISCKEGNAFACTRDNPRWTNY
jgi:hypothetical protein